MELKEEAVGRIVTSLAWVARQTQADVSLAWLRCIRSLGRANHMQGSSWRGLFNAASLDHPSGSFYHANGTANFIGWYYILVSPRLCKSLNQDRSICIVIFFPIARHGSCCQDKDKIPTVVLYTLS